MGLPEYLLVAIVSPLRGQEKKGDRYQFWRRENYSARHPDMRAIGHGTTIADLAIDCVRTGWRVEPFRAEVGTIESAKIHMNSGMQVRDVTARELRDFYDEYHKAVTMHERAEQSEISEIIACGMKLS